MSTYRAEVLYRPDSEELRYLPECPRIFNGSVLAWIAIQHGPASQEGSLNLLDLATRRNRSIALPGRPGFFAATDRPDVVTVGLERRLVRLDIRTGAIEETGVSVGQDQRVIINDGIAVPGGLVFGTKHLEFSQPLAALYYYHTAAGDLRELVGGQYCSNGKYFTADDRGCTLIDIDSKPRTITRYRFDRALCQLLDRSLVVEPDKLPAIPDGLRPTPDGAGIVVAYYNPAHTADGLAQHLRLSDGAVLHEWIVPGSPRVTCPELARIDGRTKLILTTAVEGMPPESRSIAPEAGSLFIADTPY
jgi:sugar lactone lactonase YvrE